MIGLQNGLILLGLALLGYGLVTVFGWPAITIVAGVLMIVIALIVFG